MEKNERGEQGNFIRSNFEKVRTGLVGLLAGGLITIGSFNPALNGGPGEFVRGDSTMDTVVDVGDPVRTLKYSFIGADIECKDAADSNDDGSVGMSDAIYTLNVLFRGTNQHLQPFPFAGRDLTPDDLDCGGVADQCIGKCVLGESVACGNYASRECGDFDGDGCMELGDCVSRYVGGPRVNLSSLNSSIDVHRNNRIVRPEGGIFPIGTKFNVNAFVSDYRLSGIDSVKGIISKDDMEIDSFDLECSHAHPDFLDIFLCRGIWDSSNMEGGLGRYALTVDATDMEGDVGTQRAFYNMEFRTSNGFCDELIPDHNNTQERRYNIVFTFYGYSGHLDADVREINPEFLAREVGQFIVDLDGDNKGIGAVEPFRSNMNKFNFWVSALSDLDYCVNGVCEDPSFPSYGCDFNENVYRVSVMDRGGFLNASMAYPAPYYDNLGGVREWVPSSFMHEWGHWFDNLRDQYVIDRDSEYTGQAQNRDCYAAQGGSTYEDCMENAPWVSFIGNDCGKERVLDCEPIDPNYKLEIGCFEGCGTIARGIFRSNFHNIMIGGSSSNMTHTYGGWIERLLCEKFVEDTGLAGGVCSDKYGFR
jgi:hypothetical protein